MGALRVVGADRRAAVDAVDVPFLGQQLAPID
jgi:hypothetical protein